MLLAFATSPAVPCAMTRNLSDLSAVSYCMMLSFGIPMLYNAAPNALSPPTTTAPSNAPTIQPTSGPNTMSGPMPGIKNIAEPNRNPQKPPQNAPSLPQTFMRSPTL